MDANEAAQDDVGAWRLFIAVDLDCNARRLLVAAVDACRAAEVAARWIDPRLAHLTVVFLGEVASGCAATIAGVLAAVAARQPAFTLTTGALGAFPTERRPRVIFAGVIDARKTLARLARELGDDLRALGLSVERRPFHPHLTIGRIRTGTVVPERAFDAARARFDRVPPVALPVRELRLIRSELGRDGVRYTTLATAPLGTAL